MEERGKQPLLEDASTRGQTLFFLFSFFFGERELGESSCSPKTVDTPGRAECGFVRARLKRGKGDENKRLFNSISQDGQRGRRAYERQGEEERERERWSARHDERERVSSRRGSYLFSSFFFLSSSFLFFSSSFSDLSRHHVHDYFHIMYRPSFTAELADLETRAAPCV